MSLVFRNASKPEKKKKKRERDGEVALTSHTIILLFWEAIAVLYRMNMLENYTVCWNNSKFFCLMVPQSTCSQSSSLLSPVGTQFFSIVPSAVSSSVLQHSPVSTQFFSTVPSELSSSAQSRQYSSSAQSR